MDMQTLLSAIGSTEETTFNELCSALGDDCPDRGNKGQWYELFDLIREAEQDGLVEVSKTGTKIDSLILTDAGVSRVKDARRKR